MGVGRERGTPRVQACASSCQGLTLITFGPLMATAIVGPQRGGLFLPRDSMTASVGERERRKEENMRRACDGVCVCVSLLALMLVGTYGGSCDGREQNSYSLT